MCPLLFIGLQYEGLERATRIGKTKGTLRKDEHTVFGYDSNTGHY